MRNITITLRVEDEDYEEAMDLITTSLFKGNPWLPGFLFQRIIKGFSLAIKEWGER